MREDTIDRLRALARDHLEGRVSSETYRRLRAELLDGLIAPGLAPSSGTSPPQALDELAVTTQPRATALEGMSEPRAVTPQEPVTGTRSVRPQGAASAARAAPRIARVGAGRMAALTALGLLLAVAVVLLLRYHRSKALPPPPVVAATSGGANAGPSVDPIHTLLQPLIDDNDWSDSQLLALNDALRKFSPAQIAAEHDAGWFDTAVETVRNRLREQQALASAPLTPDTSPIAALAITLGIDLATPNAAAPPPKPATAPRHGAGAKTSKGS
jgi:hypothetical protein